MSAGAYFNNAGTSWPKAPGVADAMREALELTPWEASERVETAHAAVASFFNMPSPERFVFTSGCTSALQLAVHGATWRSGDAVITSALEHEALAGPVRALVRSCGVEHVIAPRSPTGAIDVEAVEKRLQAGGVRLVALTHASNVTGELLPLARIVQLAHAHGALVLLDAAQTAGLLPLDVDALDVDAFAFAGHKGLLGPTGVGGLWVGPGLRMGVVTGSCSEGEACEADPPPSWCEAGSANAPAIAGLEAAIAWIESEGLAELRMQQAGLMTRLLAGLSEIEGLRVLGSGPALRRGNAISLVSDRKRPSELERGLREAHGLHARSGEHCSPMAQDALGTRDGGSLRLSVSPFQEEADIDRLLEALADLSTS